MSEEMRRDENVLAMGKMSEFSVETSNSAGMLGGIRSRTFVIVRFLRLRFVQQLEQL